MAGRQTGAGRRNALTCQSRFLHLRAGPARHKYCATLVHWIMDTAGFIPAPAPFVCRKAVRHFAHSQARRLRIACGELAASQGPCSISVAPYARGGACARHNLTSSSSHARRCRNDQWAPRRLAVRHRQFPRWLQRSASPRLAVYRAGACPCEVFRAPGLRDWAPRRHEYLQVAVEPGSACARQDADAEALQSQRSTPWLTLAVNCECCRKSSACRFKPGRSVTQ